MDTMKHSRQLKEEDAAEIMNVSREKLRSDRWRGCGAPFRRFGRSIRYDERELIEWMAEQSTAARAK